MNAGPDVERRVSDWLAEQTPTRAPDRILPATFERTRHARQRRFGAAWRSISMNRTWQLATAAVVGLLIIGLGVVFVSGRQGSGGGGPAASHTRGADSARRPHLSRSLQTRERCRAVPISPATPSLCRSRSPCLPTRSGA